MENSLRRKDDKRKLKRAEIKERKEKEKQQKKEELKKLQELKRKEIEEKIQQLKEITGNTDVAFNVRTLKTAKYCNILIKNLNRMKTSMATLIRKLTTNECRLCLMMNFIRVLKTNRNQSLQISMKN